MRMLKVKFEKVERETEKAVLLSIVNTNSYGDLYLTKIWFPKSQINLNGQIVELPEWLAWKKLYNFDWLNNRVALDELGVA